MKKSQILQQLLNKSRIYYIIVAAFFALLPLFVSAVTTPWITINDNAYATKVRKVSLQLWAPEGVEKMKISTESDLYDASWEPFSRVKDWTLEYGTGQRTLYVKYLDKNGKESATYSDSIYLNPPSKISLTMDIEDGADVVYKRQVVIDVETSEGVEELAVSNVSNFSGAQWRPVTSRIVWTLSDGEGKKTIYLRAKDARGNISVISESVTYEPLGSELKTGMIVRSSKSGLYYVGSDGKIHPYVGLASFHSWEKSFSNVLVISHSLLASHQVGQPVCIKPGSWLIQGKGTGEIYAVEPGCTLWPLYSKTEAALLYGEHWEKRILQVHPSELMFYSVLKRGSRGDSEDKDFDGLSEKEEMQVKSNPKTSDTDGDGLSDFEEVRIWYTDPKVKDTDGDGYDDGAEILSGYVPNGVGKIEKIPEEYSFPVGVFDSDKSLFRVVVPRNLSVRNHLFSYKANIPYRYTNGNYNEL